MRSITSITKDLTQLFRQLGYLGSTRQILIKIAKKALFPRAQLSHSQFGEDRVIANYFSNSEPGLYVDVGCNEPVNFSNTWQLYLRGWRGVVIDANPSLTQKFETFRPSDISVTAAVSNQEKEIEFYFSKNSHLISGIGENDDQRWSRTNENCDIVKLKTIRLGSILEKHNIPKDFDFLNIDTEGNERDVLESLGLNAFRPKLICVEIHDLILEELDSSAVFMFLKEHNYSLMAYIGPSAFFLANRTSS